MHLNAPTACEGDLRDDPGLTTQQEPADAPRRQDGPLVRVFVDGPAQQELGALLDSSHPTT